MKGLSMRQRETLEYMREFFAENDQLPPMSAIAKRFRFKSQNTANLHVLALERKGCIERNAVGKFRFARGQEMAASQKAGI